MTAIAASDTTTTVADERFRASEIWRIVRLQSANPSVFFYVPWIILAGAWLVSVVIALIMNAAGAPSDAYEGMRYSWAVLSPQWYLVVVGVQAISLTFPFALGFGATRRDYWLGTSLMFLIVSVVNAVLIATLVQLEVATNGWGLRTHMFNALWYGQNGWLFDAYTTFAMQLLVLFIGAGVTTVYMRWRMPGMLILTAAFVALLLGAIALATVTQSWPAIGAWFAAVGAVGIFTMVLGIALICAIGGYLVIRRATPR